MVARKRSSLNTAHGKRGCPCLDTEVSGDPRTGDGCVQASHKLEPGTGAQASTLDTDSSPVSPQPLHTGAHRRGPPSQLRCRAPSSQNVSVNLRFLEKSLIGSAQHRDEPVPSHNWLRRPGFIYSSCKGAAEWAHMALALSQGCGQARPPNLPDAASPLDLIRVKPCSPQGNPRQKQVSKHG